MGSGLNIIRGELDELKKRRSGVMHKKISRLKG